ncbi:polysaccharide biosynthesis/export family protein [Frigidibacter sp. MR17.24]|uniref:polysaccharide biosynthesis/export family protein n=1 Tax=Frigidibacter sp. MR17.24 TaxID=3127345 RepID=UPI003012B0EC
MRSSEERCDLSRRGPGLAAGLSSGLVALALGLAAATAPVGALAQSQGQSQGQSQPARAAPEAAYVLGPQDQLSVRVNSLRRNTGEIYTWAPLSDTFSIGADGTVFLPIVGQLTAAGTTPDALAASISTALQNVANLAETPFTTVEVTTYRPVYVMGSVQQPGRYEFQPGMTVLQALSTAQGFVRSPDVSGTQRDAIAAGGDVRSLEAAGIVLQAQLVRFAAESEGGTAALSFPPELAARAAQDPRIATAIRHETERYEAGREALRAEAKAIEDGRALLGQELEQLAKKADTLNRQQELYDEEAKISADLLTRGLTVQSRQVAAENSQLNVQSSQLDVQLATLRAQQSLQQADRDIIDLRARYRTQALDNLVTTRQQLEANRQQLQTAQALVTLAMSRSLETLDSADLDGFTPEYRVVRNGDSGRSEQVVGDDFRLQPGDVLQVQMSQAAPVQ